MVPRSRSLLFFKLLALGACHLADAHRPDLSRKAPADSAAPPASESAASSTDADPPPPPSTGPLVVDLHGKATLPPPIPDGAPRLASVAMLTEVYGKPDTKATKV